MIRVPALIMAALVGMGLAESAAALILLLPGEPEPARRPRFVAAEVPSVLEIPALLTSPTTPPQRRESEIRCVALPCQEPEEPNELSCDGASFFLATFRRPAGPRFDDLDPTPFPDPFAVPEEGDNNEADECFQRDKRGEQSALPFDEWTSSFPDRSLHSGWRRVKPVQGVMP
jgi:hypothetical protein